MELDFLFIANSILLGAGLAMDAFSVSLVNGLKEPDMSSGKAMKIAGVFGSFQGVMPLTGWFLVHTLLEYFKKAESLIPWVSLVLLVYTGGRMLIEGIKGKDGSEHSAAVGGGTLFVQGLATSVDALSVGFTIAAYDFPGVLICVMIIAAVTFAICAAGVELGRKMGTKLSGKAEILGGIILIFIGIETFFRFP